jgi:membrane-associated phospholipid phosphatase
LDSPACSQQNCIHAIKVYGILPMMGENTKNLIATTLMVTVVFATADLYYLLTASIILDSNDFVQISKVVAVLLVCGLIATAVKQYVSRDPTRIARIIVRGANSLQLLVLSAILFMPLSYVSTLFMYAASATQRPLMDAELAALDSTLGFDWVWFLETANSSSILANTLVFSYHSLGVQVPLLGLFFCVTFQAERLMEFIALFAVSLLISCVVMAMVPAEGAYAYFNPAQDAHSNFTSLAGIWHSRDLELLRSGEPFYFTVAKVEGLVTFPSFHTALGILVVYTLRGIPILLFPVAALNALMIVSTLPEGGHHLVDVLAGTIVAVLSIAVVRTIAVVRRDLRARRQVGSVNRA